MSTADVGPTGEQADGQSTAPWSTHSWAAMERLGPLHVYPSGVTVFEEGNRPSDVYLIEDGVVRVFRWEGDEQVDVILRFRPWLLGAPALFTGRRFCVSAETMSRCRLRQIDTAALQRQLRTDPLVLWDVAALVAQDNEDVVGQLGYGALPSRRRLERTLHQLAMRFGKPCNRGIRLALPMTLDELAQAVHITPQWRSHLLRHLEREGLIIREKGHHVIIRNLEKLWHGDGA